jgi:hypothetical protein
MADAKISQLPVATTPLAGTELVPLVQGGVTVQSTVDKVLTGTVPSGTANGVLFLNGSKVVTSGSGLVFDSSGNLGLGVTPSAWSPTGTQSTAFEVKDSGNSGKTSSLASAGGDLQLSNNAYYNGSNWKYVSANSHQAANYYQSAGTHVWRTAPSGTAGNDISFTDAMTLDASGNLLVGTTSNASNYRAILSLASGELLGLNATSGSLTRLAFGNTTAAFGNTQIIADGNDLAFVAGNAERVRIKSTGQVRFVPLAADPAGAEAGDVYYNSGTNKLRLYDGSTWVDLN